MKLKKYILFRFNSGLDGSLKVIGTYNTKKEMKNAVLDWMDDVDLGLNEGEYLPHFNYNSLKIDGNIIYNEKNNNFGFGDDKQFIFIESKELFS